MLIVTTPQRTQGLLSQLLEAESKVKVENARTASSRHSRFGTTIAVRLNQAKSQGEGNDPADASTSSSFVLHRQQALNKESGAILDMKKKKKFKKSNKVDEVSRNENLSGEAMTALRECARTFIESCFNSKNSRLPFTLLLTSSSFLGFGFERHQI